MKDKPRLLRITTVPISLKLLLRGQLEFMQREGFDVLAVSADGPEIPSIVNEGVTHTIIPFTRKITPIQDLICIWQLIRIIRRFKPHIVHTHTPKAGLLGMIAAWMCRVPVRMHTVAGLPLMEKTGLTQTVLKFTERITYWCSHKVYPNSFALKEYIVKEIYSSPKLQVIGKGSSNGIDTTFFRPTPGLQDEASRLKNDFGFNDNRVVFSFVGRIVTDKGVNELVKAFDKLSGEFNCGLILGGVFEDDLDPVLDETRTIIKTNKNIVCPGYLNDVRPAILASDIFILPSYREGFPNVVMQGACLERACIVTNINGCNEIIQHEVTGLVIEPKNTESLYKAMKELLTNPAKRKRFGIESRVYVAANYDQSYLWKLILEEYKTLLQ